MRFNGHAEIAKPQSCSTARILAEKNIERAVDARRPEGLLGRSPPHTFPPHGTRSPLDETAPHKRKKHLRANACARLGLLRRPPSAIRCSVSLCCREIDPATRKK